MQNETPTPTATRSTRTRKPQPAKPITTKIKRSTSKERRKATRPTGEWPESSLSYHAGWYQQNKTWVLATLKGFLKEQSDSCVVKIPWNKCVKFGKRVHMPEAFALRLVAEKTSVPVPKVINAF